MMVFNVSSPFDASLFFFVVGQEASKTVKTLARKFGRQICEILIKTIVIQNGDQLIFFFCAPTSLSLSDSFSHLRNGVL
jgi:hypothetical protein